MNTATITPIAKSIELETANAPLVNAANTTALVLDGNSMDKMMTFAQMMSTSKITIPKHLQGNAGDCFAIVMQSMQWGMNPFAVAQKTHLVNGVLGYEAQLVNAVINSRAPITGRLNYEWFGDWSRIIGRFKEVPAKNNPDEKRIVRDWTLEDEKGLGVRVWATIKGEDEPRILELMLSQAGVRNSPLWGQDPKQQLAYLATKRWARIYCPDVILGVYTSDEFEEASEPKDVTPKESKTASIRDKVAAKKEAAKPKPQVIDAEPTPQDDAAFNNAVQNLEQSQTIDELKAHGKKIAESGFSEQQIADLTVAYKAKLKELQDVAAFEAQEAERLAAMEQ